MESALQAAGGETEKTPLLAATAQPSEPAAPSKAVEASAVNQEAIAAAPAGTDTSSASTEPASAPEQSPASKSNPTSGMQR